MRIALAGNPNSGKTTMYNALTGKNEKVGNWAGVTVDKKQSPVKSSYCKNNEEIIAVDLPGAYSISPFTGEESITRDFIKSEKPDAIINIVDGTNLSRSLFFTTQLLELGIPVVVAVNKSDVNKKKKTTIDTALLSKLLACPVIETVSTDHEGLSELINAAIGIAGGTQKAPFYEGHVDGDDKSARSLADRQRFDFVKGIVKKVEKRKILSREINAQDKLDSYLTSKWLGLPVFALIMYLVFQISQAWLGAWIAEGFSVGGFEFPGLTGLMSMFKDLVAGWISGAAPILQAILLEGIIEGVSAVLGFLPLVMVMYFCIALLEDCGYMARVSVLLDPIFKKVGLSGKSVIAFVIGIGCAVPGVMASRTIRNERERRATAMLAPFMPCGAKLPVIALFTGAFFPHHPWISFAMYFLGIAVIFFGALLVNAIAGHRPKNSYFIIEIPEYKFPSLWRAFVSMCARGRSYIVKAGTVILVCNFLVFIMQTYDWSFSEVADPSHSILHDIATPVAYFIAPFVGVVAWQFAAAAVTGFIAKECVVGTLATCFVFERILDSDMVAVTGEASQAAGAIWNVYPSLTSFAILAYLMFNLFSPPCFAAIGAMNAEMNSKKWLFAGVGLQLGMGYTIAFSVYFFGSLFTNTGFFNNEASAPLWMALLGWAVVLLFAAVLAVLILRARAERSNEAKAKKAVQKV